MAGTLVVDNSLMTVWVYPLRRIVHHQMKGYCFGPEFREGLTRGVEAMEQYKAIKWLSDNRAHSALPPEDEEWAVKHWFPRAKAAGWRCWAVVQPAKVIGQVNMERIARIYIDHGVDARLFSDPVLAMKWLDEA
jgi:hypothetical protein